MAARRQKIPVSQGTAHAEAARPTPNMWRTRKATEINHTRSAVVADKKKLHRDSGVLRLPPKLKRNDYDIYTVKTAPLRAVIS